MRGYLIGRQRGDIQIGDVMQGLKYLEQMDSLRDKQLKLLIDSYGDERLSLGDKDDLDKVEQMIRYYRE